jgi:hypothetical protein
LNPGLTRFLSSFAAWVFGLATTVLLISFWGRAVVVDTDELADNLAPLSESEEVTGRFSDWMTTQLTDSGVPSDPAEEAATLSLFTPEVKQALAALVGEVVHAAAEPAPEGTAVDMASIFTPTVPAVTASLASQGIPAPETEVASIVAGLDPLVIREPGAAPMVGSASPTARRLGIASVLAGAALVVFGALYVLVSGNWVRAMRTLSTRFAVGALTFALLLKLGSWVLDPGGGRAPVSESLSQLADSKWLIPAFIGLAASMGALFFWVIRSTKPVAANPPTV